MWFLVSNYLSTLLLSFSHTLSLIDDIAIFSLPHQSNTELDDINTDSQA